MCRDEGDAWIAVEIKRVATIDAVEQLTRYLDRIRLDPAMSDTRGVLAAQQIKPQARTLAEARGIACVEVDLAVLRGEREPDLTLFAVSGVSLRADEARRIALRAQGLLGAPDRRGGVPALLRRLGAVQLDTISVLARSHELVPYARLGPIGASGSRPPTGPIRRAPRARSSTGRTPLASCRPRIGRRSPFAAAPSAPAAALARGLAAPAMRCSGVWPTKAR